MIPLSPFYLIRHGESELNVLRRAAGGGIDTPLTARGIEQAEAAEKIVAVLPVLPSVLIHSPLSRARKTAEIINRSLGLPMIAVDDLCEHRFGQWEMMPWDELRPILDSGGIPPDGESYPEFAARVARAISPFLLASSATAPPLFVAHGGTFRAIAELYGWRNGEKIKNCQVSLFSPAPELSGFPWIVTNFDKNERGLSESRAVFCPKS